MIPVDLFKTSQMNTQQLSVKILLLSFIVLIMHSCKSTNGKNPAFVNAIIAHGTSFGMCNGYCHKELSVTEDNVSYVQTKRATPAEEKKCEQSLTAAAYKQIINEVDLKSFSKMDSVIGCPDCADGGAEWLEITSAGVKKRVTFEYGKAPLQFKNLIEKLNKLKEGIQDCKEL